MIRTHTFVISIVILGIIFLCSCSKKQDDVAEHKKNVEYVSLTILLPEEIPQKIGYNPGTENHWYVDDSEQVKCLWQSFKELQGELTTNPIASPYMEGFEQIEFIYEDKIIEFYYCYSDGLKTQEDERYLINQDDFQNWLNDVRIAVGLETFQN